MLLISDKSTEAWLDSPDLQHGNGGFWDSCVLRCAHLYPVQKVTTWTKTPESWGVGSSGTEVRLGPTRVDGMWIKCGLWAPLGPAVILILQISFKCIMFSFIRVLMVLSYNQWSSDAKGPIRCSEQCFHLRRQIQILQIKWCVKPHNFRDQRKGGGSHFPGWCCQGGPSKRTGKQTSAWPNPRAHIIYFNKQIWYNYDLGSLHKWPELLFIKQTSNKL